MATRGATVHVRPTPGLTAKLVSASSSGGGDEGGSDLRKLSSNSSLLKEGPATIEKLTRTGCSPTVYATPAISGRTRRLMKSPPSPVGLSMSARNQLRPPARPQPFLGFRRTRGPQPTSDWTSLSVGFTQVTEPPTLTRPFVCAAAETAVHNRSAVTTNARLIDSQPR